MDPFENAVLVAFNWSIFVCNYKCMCKMLKIHIL